MLLFAFSGIGRWITYINSAEYQQIEPSNASISESELRRHNKSDDMWMALNHEGKRKFWMNWLHFHWCLISLSHNYLTVARVKAAPKGIEIQRSCIQDIPISFVKCKVGDACFVICLPVFVHFCRLFSMWPVPSALRTTNQTWNFVFGSESHRLCLCPMGSIHFLFNLCIDLITASSAQSYWSFDLGSG